MREGKREGREREGESGSECVRGESARGRAGVSEWSDDAHDVETLKAHPKEETR